MERYDLNCDTGEGIGNEAELMPYITSANIACGNHAGDRDTMKQVVELCVAHNVAIGAHPSFRDRENFGRIDLIGKGLKPADVQELVAEQVHILQQVVKECGAVLHHIKPHGALYNRAAWDVETGAALCSGIIDIDPELLVYGLSGSALREVAQGFGLRFWNEVFADRTYQENGSLTPRTQPGALIEEEEKAIRQVTEMLLHQTVQTALGKRISIEAQTICLHGDGSHAVTFARRLHSHLQQIIPQNP
ncbi:MAG: LamB/YcsF family protein [Flaviaesturariibacter sp.]|nr:LamB/YcsF family protein [Flaviaesturariibacter sp.]